MPSSSPGCPRCGAPVASEQRFCGRCGMRSTRLQDETATSIGESPSFFSSGPGSDPASQGRFLPGAVFAARYRIFGLIGLGGMGEVYRADDLKLGQTVALKFLPEALEQEGGRLQRFLHEIRIARQISHPNVCRVYDVGEHDGHHYLSMEFIDGEDLASLLRRIGRLPEDKAVQAARQLCAGLAAAHDQGIVHRDLKPANIMIDGRGGVRITDFGLAGLAESIEGAEVRAGTPAYMSPEQLEGREVSLSSDLYALGVVLYELFTGKRAFEASSFAEIQRLQRDSDLTRPTTLLEGLSPAVERTILHCLEFDAEARPAGALAVAAALPGGDPLAEALAAGETPSPELVAATGRAEAMPAWKAFGIAAIALACIVLGAAWSGQRTLFAYLPLEKSPTILVDRSQEIIEALGFDEPVYADPIDEAYGYSIWQSQISLIGERGTGDDRWAALRNPDAEAMAFWYRQSPSLMFPEPSDRSFTPGRVARWSPPPILPGMILVSTTPSGELRFFVHTPHRYRTRVVDPELPDPAPVFALAGLDLAAFAPAEPRYQRFMQLEHRSAWTGSMPGLPDVPVRVETGYHDGRLALFALLYDWEIETLSAPPRPAERRFPGFLAMLLAILAAGTLVARANLMRGRADRRGAFRLAAGVFGITFLVEALRSHPLKSLNGLDVLFPMLATALFYAAIVYMLYLALEPHARRVWPRVLVSWTRLTSRGRYALLDPLIGRTVLFGILVGSLLAFLTPLDFALRDALEGATVRPWGGNWGPQHGTRSVWSAIVEGVLDGIVDAFFFAFVMVGARMLLKRTWATAIGASVTWILINGLGGGGTLGDLLISLPSLLAITAAFAFVMLRNGLLGLIAASIVFNLHDVARTADWSAWHARPGFTTIALLAVVVLAAAAIASRGHGRPRPV